VTDETIRLKDGGRLGITVTGPSDGRAIFYFHSRGLCRLESLSLGAAANRLASQIIGVDRPGIGLSDPRSGYRIIDWPDDIAAAADQLGLDHFAVLGLSAGAAYALSCAFKIPQRLTACGLVSSVSPGSLIRQSAPLWKRGISWTLEHQSWLVRVIIQGTLSNIPDTASIEKIMARFERIVGEPDKKLLDDPTFRATFARGLAESLRQGKAGNLDDIVRQVKPWGFPLEAIAFDKIFLWHGSDDRIVPATAAKVLARTLPNCVLTICPGEGHFSTLINRADEILTLLRGRP
jgi:pimeloyl-ACP methyl ester carboxylesterase